MTRLRSFAGLLAGTPFHPRWLIERRAPPEGLSRASGIVLDIGAADRWIHPFVPAAARYVALDSRTTGAGLYAARPDVFADGARLPFADATIDAVLCLEVLEHVPDPAAILGEIARVLPRGGRAWISVPFLYPIHDAPYDYQRFTIHGLRLGVERVGLTVVAERKNGHAVRAAALLACLAIAGGPYRRGGISNLLMPLATLLVLVVNCAAWLLILAWPDWESAGVGYQVEAIKL